MHDYQIGEGPVGASSPPPPPGFVIPAESPAAGEAAAAAGGVEGGLAAEGATAPVVTPVGDGADVAAASALPGVAAAGATGVGAAAASPYGLVGRKDTASTASTMDGAPPPAPVMGEKERSYYTNVRSGSDGPLPPPPPPAIPVPPPPVPAVDPAPYGVPPEAPDFPAADEYGAGVEEPASFGGKMMSGLTGGLAAGGAGTYESAPAGTAAGAGGEARDMGMPVLDSPEYSDLRANATDGYGRR